LTAAHSAYLPADLHHFHHTVTGSLKVMSHLDLLIWLQGDMQHYLPHDMLIAAWGDFQSGAVRHDVVTAIPGVRSLNGEANGVNAFLAKLYAKWRSFGKTPYCFNSMDSGFWLQELADHSVIGDAFRKMRSALVHGVVDQRGANDCLYVFFSASPTAAEVSRIAMPTVLPYLDIALRQVEHLPHQKPALADGETEGMEQLIQESGLSGRELEILRWVTLGKTNPEIGAILDLSEFTVKNHLKRIFKKLDVLNRAQAVGKFQSWVSHA
jgi:transcriptional regulator EpsA